MSQLEMELPVETISRSFSERWVLNGSRHPSGFSVKSDFEVGF